MIYNIGNYYLQFNKIPLRMNWNSNDKYIYQIHFLDYLKITVFVLNLTESDIINIFSCIFDYNEFGCETYVPLTCYDSNMCNYTLNLLGNRDSNIDILSIREYNPSQEIIKEKIKIIFDNNIPEINTLFNFLELIYREFLESNKEYDYIQDYIYFGG